MKEKKESIIKMLEMADERETEITYFFVLNLLDMRGEGETDCHTVVRDGSQ